MDNDFFLFDTERLHAVAADDRVKQGLAYFSENRVFDLDLHDGILSAQVEDEEADLPYSVELSEGVDMQLKVDCHCGDHQLVCKHAVAALFAFADQFGGDEETLLGSAVEEAIAERVKKGRNEVRVKLISGNLGFGIWQASSIQSATHWQQTYQVQIRSLDQRMNYCTCPDLASNRLGTCKHIEAVLHYASKQPDYKKLKQAGCPVSFVYLSWESATHPVLRLHHSPHIETDLAELLVNYFNADGSFKGRLPEDFFRLSEQVFGREDLQLGDDAVRYARQCAEDAVQAERGRQIAQEILRANGVLPGIKARLFPYQTEGVAFLASRGRALLADDMGLGKTLQAITAASWMADNLGIRRVLIVCPASLKSQWAREIEKFTSHTARIVQGPAESRSVHYRADALFFIVNYELILRDLSVITETLKPDLVILDEAQRIKNWRTKIASSVKLIPSRYVFVLSGTPLENRLEDLYSLLQVIDARVLGPLWRCLLDFHVTDERGKVIGYRNLSELRRRIAPVMLRRNRSLVSDQLPDRTEVRLDIPMTPQQIELHGSALSAAGYIAQIAKRRPLTPSEQNRFMAALQQARMACNAAGLVDKETEGSPKLDEMVGILEEICLESSRKVVIFSQWVLMTEMVEARVRAMGLGCVRLHGGVPSEKRGELMERFEKDDSVQVFISTDAGGTGLNLQSATVLINLDMPWNPAILDQRIARIHRLGQKENVLIFLLLSEDSYEQQVAKLVQNKRDLFDNVIDPEASEDVVGVSKKMLQTLIEGLAEPAPPKPAPPKPGEQMPPPLIELEERLETEAVEKPEKTDIRPEPLAKEDESDSAVRRLIVNIQDQFGSRIERILGAGGGLLVVLNRVDDTDEEAARDLSEPDVPVAVIDRRTLTGLQRLGAASPVAQTEVLFEPSESEAEPVNPLHQSAEDKLKSAELLWSQHANAGVMDLLTAALLAKAAAVSGKTQSPPAEQATVWLYGELLPQQLVTQEQAAAFARVFSLGHAPSVPDALIEQCLTDVRWLFSVLA
ncbi:SNF2-related protein [Methylotuvimicrobium sp. KM1]|uniref:SNF2-related protein n=1 Tax=Methylotuvimicrobium sp. KM1 TaxID=3377707 RepID=UPI00384C4CBA